MKQKDAAPDVDLQHGYGAVVQRTKKQSAKHTRFREPSAKALAGQGTRTHPHDPTRGQESRGTHRASDRHRDDPPREGSYGSQKG